MNNKLPLKTIYAWYVVAVLMVCYTFSFVDRQILNLIIAGLAVWSIATIGCGFARSFGQGILRND